MRGILSVLLTGALMFPGAWAQNAATGGVESLAQTQGSAGFSREQCRQIQKRLASVGFNPGPADGICGARTREAIRGWQAARGEAATGYLTEGQARALMEGGSEAAGPAAAVEGIWEVRSIPVEGVHRYVCTGPADTSTSATWSGQCAGGKPTGHGVIAAEDEDTGYKATGGFVDGKKNGRWVYRKAMIGALEQLGYEVDLVMEGSYVDGKRNGHWVERGDDGSVWEGPYVDGERQDEHWVWRSPLSDCKDKLKAETEALIGLNKAQVEAGSDAARCRAFQRQLLHVEGLERRLGPRCYALLQGGFRDMMRSDLSNRRAVSLCRDAGLL